MFSALMGFLLSFGGGFAFSGTTIAGVSTFADISLAGAVELPFAIVVFIGAVVRCAITDSVGKSIVKLTAIVIILIAKMFSSRCSRPVVSGIVTAAAVVISGAAISWLIGELPEKLLFYALYGMISGFTSFSGAEIYQELRRNHAISIKGASGCACGVVYIVFISSLCSVDIPIANPGIMAAAAVTVTGAYFYGITGGMICGALGATGAFLASADIGAAAAVLPAAGLLSGVTGKGKIFLSAAFFSLCSFMLSVLMGVSASYELTLSIIFGASLFMIAAPYYTDRWIDTGAEKNSVIPDINRIRLNFLSDSIEALRSDSDKISEALSNAARERKTPTEARKNVCKSCGRRSLCKGVLPESSEELIPVLPLECIHKKEAAENMEKELRTRTARQLMELRYSDERRFLAEQLKITGEMIRKAGEAPDIRYSASISKRIAEKLKNHDIAPTMVTAGYTASNRLTAEIYFDKGDITAPPERIRDLVADELEKKLTAAASVSSAKELRIGLFEPPAFSVEVYSASVCASGSELSGDGSAFFSDSHGTSYIVLSDGMGSGRSAAVDSHMVIGLFKRLICSGMEPRSAVKLVNSVMVTKSHDESFATLDAVILDLDNCSAVSIKSGAAPTIIRRKGDVIKISAPTFPIGIIEEAELFISEQQLEPDDMIIMFSDGISENAYFYIKELLLNGNNIHDIVREIAVKAEIFNPTSRPDDVTVIGAKIKRT